MNNRSYEKIQPDDNGVESGQYFRHDGYEKTSKSLGVPLVESPAGGAGRQATMTNGNGPIRGRRNCREMFAWGLVLVQFILLAKTTSSSFDGNSYFNGTVKQSKSSSTSGVNSEINFEMNRHPNEYYERRRMEASPNTAFYESPQVFPKEAGLVSRTWRSNGSPLINPHLHMGSCWCSADEWCVCTPALAVDIILRSGEDHIWVVRREDTGLLALTGGFTEVGETSEESLHRELYEEMGLTLTTRPVLFGIYNDPRRDTRRHSTSVVYIADLPPDVSPRAGDDAVDVVRLPVAEIENNDFFIDHKTVLHDYVQMRRAQMADASGQPREVVEDMEPFKRSFCRY